MKKMLANAVDISPDIKIILEGHLPHLTTWFEKYFPNENINKFSQKKDLFNTNALSEFTSAEEESLIELSCDNS